MRSPYEILGIPEDASPHDIKRAYKLAAIKCHPDRNPGDPAATERFQELERAYAILKDPTKRERYDATGMDSSDLATMNRAYDSLCELYMMLLSRANFVKQNYIPDMKRQVQQKIRTQEEHRDEALASRDKLLYMIDHTEMVEQVVVRMQAYAKEFDRERLGREQELACLFEMAKILESFEYSGQEDNPMFRKSGAFTQANFTHHFNV